MRQARKSKVLQEHFNWERNISHLRHLDWILGFIDQVHLEKFITIRNNIELALLNNPKSSNEVVSYLSEIWDKLKNISNNYNLKIREETVLAAW